MEGGAKRTVWTLYWASGTEGRLFAKSEKYATIHSFVTSTFKGPSVAK